VLGLAIYHLPQALGKPIIAYRPEVSELNFASEEDLLLQVPRDGIEPAQIATSQHLAGRRDGAAVAVADGRRLFGIEVVGRVKVRDQYPIDRVCELSFLARVAHFNKKLHAPAVRFR